MPYLPVHELACFDTLPLRSRVIVLRRYLDALAQADYEYLRQNPNTPALYDWAPKYEIKSRPFSLDSWQDIPTTMQKGTGDCKDFAAWRVSELHNKGYKVGFHIKTQVIPDAQRGDLVVYHIQVEGYDDRSRFVREDPSKLLGMPLIVTPEQMQKVMTG